MDFSFSVPTPLEHFESLVQSDEHFPLLEAAAAVACIEYPQLDIQQVVNEVDQLLGQLRASRDANSRSALTRLKALNHHFYADWGFQGNPNDFYAPDNSCLNAVLHRRRGIPVSLAVIWLELAAELQRRSTGRTLYVLDEPTTGLHFQDIEMLLKVLHRLADHGNTVVVIEHNLDVISTADWIVDLGPEGGDGGGRILAAGTPKVICKTTESHTGHFLKPLLARHR